MRKKRHIPILPLKTQYQEKIVRIHEANMRNTMASYSDC